MDPLSIGVGIGAVLLPLAWTWFRRRYASEASVVIRAAKIIDKLGHSLTEDSPAPALPSPVEEAAKILNDSLERAKPVFERYGLKL